MDQLQQYQMQMLSDPDFRERIEGMAKSLEKVPPGPKRAEFAHQFADGLLKHDLDNLSQDIKDQINCKDSCGNCCYIMVAITDDEADLIIRDIKERGLYIDVERLERQKKAEATTGQEYMQRISYKNRRCVFLNDADNCKIYKHRPLSCRGYVAIGGPIPCDTREGTMGVPCVMSKNQLMIECAATLACGREELGAGLMAEKLLERL